ncbi:MAG: DUF5615 family PIN-like protein [Bacteroidota bacterium]|nr:DUF5615 family PIN-like protein [Bacteroidota bacterium]
MKLLIDENLSWRICKLLLPLFEKVVHVKDAIAKVKSTDWEIREYAKSNGYSIVTCDDDFIKYLMSHGFPPKIIKISISHPSYIELANIIKEKHKEIMEFNSNSEMGLFEIYD